MNEIQISVIRYEIIIYIKKYREPCYALQGAEFEPQNFISVVDELIYSTQSKLWKGARLYHIGFFALAPGISDRATW